MNPIIATHYGLGDVALMIALSVGPSVLAIATFSFALIAWRRRKELGFFVLSIGLGMQMLIICTGAVLRLRGIQPGSEMLGSIWLFGLPPVIALVGWGLLAMKKNDQA